MPILKFKIENIHSFNSICACSIVSSNYILKCLILLAMFMAAMEATVVGTAMPTVIADLGGIALYGWVGASYLLASTVTVPLYGKLADLYGRKPVVLFGISVFLVGSVASGFATSQLPDAAHP